MLSKIKVQQRLEIMYDEKHYQKLAPIKKVVWSKATHDFRTTRRYICLHYLKAPTPQVVGLEEDMQVLRSINLHKPPKSLWKQHNQMLTKVVAQALQKLFIITTC